MDEQYDNFESSYNSYMFGQKFNPYGQFPSKNNQHYEEQYEQQDSQPLVQQVDPSYEPTEKQVRQYAIQTLGMNLPEDEGFLYLAREGLKAPLPPNWVPYQGRDGEVYYKHRITQEKTYDHPTDIEYQKLYMQQKEKMARKNLKSMNMKANVSLNIQNSSSLGNASNLYGSKMNNITNINGMSSISAVPNVDISNSYKIDPRIEEEYEEQLKRVEEKLKRQMKQFEEQQAGRHENKIKKLKQQYENDLEKLYKNKNGEIRLEDKLRQQKQRIKDRIQQQFTRQSEDELKQFERQLWTTNKQFQSVYEEDSELKLRKYQHEKDEEFKQREQRYNENMNKINKKISEKKKEKQQGLRRLREELTSGRNKQIEEATAIELQNELSNIKAKYSQMVREKQIQLDREFNQTKRILGYDQNSFIAQFASKKARIKAISEQKNISFKKTQIQKVNEEFEKQLFNEINKIKLNYEQSNHQNISQERSRLERKLAEDKSNLDKEIKHKTQTKLQNIYEQLKLQIKSYECEMNKKLTTLNEKFISDIQGKSKGQNKDIILRMEIKQKEMNVDNKQKMVDSLSRQIYLQKITYQLLQLQKQLSKCRDEIEVEEKLNKLAKKYQIQYRSTVFLKYQGEYQQFKAKTKRDKQFLASVMNQLQGYGKTSGVGGTTILKQYNQDVRNMRVNEQLLRKMESLLKKAQLNDRQAIESLANNKFEYIEMELKKEVDKGNPLYKQELRELNQKKEDEVRSSPYQYNVENVLKDHSKFLSSMRSQLNSKLYQLRSSYY